jgi:hypothetical protein
MPIFQPLTSDYEPKIEGSHASNTGQKDDYYEDFPWVLHRTYLVGTQPNSYSARSLFYIAQVFYLRAPAGTETVSAVDKKD